MLRLVSQRDDLYRVLQVDPEASPLVIQAAYRVLARIFHPDVEGDDEQMKRINHAWGVLGDPRRRAEYDRQRAGRHPGPRPSTSSAAPAHRSAAAASAGRSFSEATAASSARGFGPAAGAAAGAAAGTAATTVAGAGRDPRGEAHAGPPQGEPFGPVLRFGRYEGWTLGQVVRVDRPWLEWLRSVPAGRGLKADIDAVLQVKRGPGAVDERRLYEAAQAKVHAWTPGAPTKLR